MRWAALIAIAAPLALPGVANAGTATLKLPTSLKARGITAAAQSPATLRGRTVTFPLDQAAAGSLVLQARGALRLRARGQSVTLRAPQLVGSSRVTSLLGGQRTTVWTRSGTRVKLAPTAARTIARRLRVKVPRTFGTLTAAPSYTAAELPCRATIAGGTPPAPGSGEPPVKPRPAGAIAITSATVTWHVRESFVRYIATGEGTTVSGGVTEGPRTGDDPPLVYDFHFPHTGGWCDPATGAAQITFGGTVRFSYSDHDIDLRASDPEVELDGPTSRVIFTVGRRTVVETLDVSEATVRVDGKTFSYDRIPAAVPPGTADSVFSGYYLPGEPFGWVSITFTTA
jgi:hypothetical protein